MSRDLLDPLDPLAVDREIGRTTSAWRRWCRKPLPKRMRDDPFLLTQVAGRTAFQAVGEMAESDPLRRPLRRFIYRLAEARIDGGVGLAVAQERYLTSWPLDAPERTELSVAKMLDRALRGDANAWLSALLDHCEPLHERVLLLWQRRQEIAHRMGLENPDCIELPGRDLADHAASWLERTADLTEGLPAGFAAQMTVSLGLDSPDGWPARLEPRALVGFFDETDWFHRDLDLELGPLPDALGPSSFLRGLARLGAAWVDASAPQHQPFVIRHDPYGLRRYTLGALLGGLPLSAPFARRRLGAGAGLAEQRRTTAKMMLCASRLAALRVLLRTPALAGRAQLAEAFETETERTFGEPLPARAAGVLVRLRVDDAQRFAGLLLAASLQRRLLEQHDEDWFRNPRAVEQLRDEADASPDVEVETDTLDAGADELAQALRSGL